MIGQIVKKWQPFIEIQDSGYQILKNVQLCISDVIDKLQIQRRNICIKFYDDRSIIIIF